MRLHIPELGTKLVLTADWTFDLHFERRNEKFGGKMNITPPTPDPYAKSWAYTGWNQPERSISVTLPAGTILTVSRIYIRSGAKKFSSVTFFAHLPNPKGKGKPVSKGRFWAKLAKVNEIECEILES